MLKVVLVGGSTRTYTMSGYNAFSALADLGEALQAMTHRCMAGAQRAHDRFYLGVGIRGWVADNSVVACLTPSPFGPIHPLFPTIQYPP